MLALGLLLLTALLFVGLTFWRRRAPASLRLIDAYERLNRSVGLAVENGTRLHISLGRGNLLTARGGSALAGLAMLRRLAERTSVSDRPPRRATSWPVAGASRTIIARCEGRPR